MRKFLHFLKYSLIKVLKLFKIYKDIKYFEQKFPDIKFDKKWYDHYLSTIDIYSCSLKRIKLKNLKCIVWQENRWNTKPLSQSPVFQYLKSNDKQSYIKYHDMANAATADAHSVETFENLIKHLDETGYDDTNPICVNRYNGIIDGQHRAAYLLNKYGEDYEITVFKICF